MIKYDILFSESVEGDLRSIRKFNQAMVLAEIERHLGTEPDNPSKKRKLLGKIVPPFPCDPPLWELKVGEFRIFYDVNRTARKVLIRAVRHKPPHKTTEEIL